MMRWLANENVPRASVFLLREAGWDVLAISEKHAGISDTEVMGIACEEGRAILTHDRDYGELVYVRGLQCPPAVLYLRGAPETPETSGRLALVAVTQLSELIGWFTTLQQDGTARQRRLPKG